MTASRQHDAERRRAPLTRERVLRAAVDVADRDGIDGLTMRSLAHELGVEAMSLYYHVANKEAILDGIVDEVVGEILDAVGETGPTGAGWQSVMRSRILTARAVLVRHPWAPAVIETRTSMSPPIVAYFESVLGTFRAGGFSWDLAHRAMHALGSRALGFTQELFAPDDVEAGDEAAREMLAHMADQLPNLVGMMQAISHEDSGSTLGWCDDQAEFEFGLDLILDGLDRLNTEQRRT